jgi:hypothetical protein
VNTKRYVQSQKGGEYYGKYQRNKN